MNRRVAAECNDSRHQAAVRSTRAECVLCRGAHPDDTVLVLAKTIISAPGKEALTRAATHVFRKDPAGNWRCAIGNSCGHELLASALSRASPEPP